jgi:pyruvate ferredoxin oxidoreductase gamma subunit
LVGPQTAEGIREGGALLINSARPAGEWAAIGVRVLSLDVDKVAGTVLGRPIANTGMMGALLAASGAVRLEAALHAIQSEMRTELAEKNGEVLRRCYDMIKERQNA